MKVAFITPELLQRIQSDVLRGMTRSQVNVNVEDGVAESDWTGWKLLTRELGARVEPALFAQLHERPDLADLPLSDVLHGRGLPLAQAMPARTTWREILWLAERLQPEPALLPDDPSVN